jgi:hypothetical protein
MNCRWYLLLLTLAVAGCNSEPTGEIVATVPVSGTLTFNGAPLEYHQVAFFPENSRPAIGVTGEDGRFTLGTNSASDGAVVGRHQVAITYVGKPSDNPDEGIMEFSSPPPPKQKIPGKYNAPDSSGITIEVPSSGTTDLTIDLN